MADLADLTQAIEAGNRSAACSPIRRPTVSGRRAAGQAEQAELSSEPQG